MDEGRLGSFGHEISIVNREQMMVKGVTHVDSFDDQEIVLETEVGLVAIRGEDLHIKQINLDQGQLAVEGSIGMVEYASGPRLKGGRIRSRSLMDRLFR